MLLEFKVRTCWKEERNCLKWAYLNKKSCNLLPQLRKDTLNSNKVGDKSSKKGQYHTIIFLCFRKHKSKTNFSNKVKLNAAIS